MRTVYLIPFLLIALISVTLYYLQPEPLRAVTVAEFRQFVTATGYVTDAERIGSAGWVTGIGEAAQIDGADWERPDGVHPDPDDYPVRQVSWGDAVSYCNWRGCRLPNVAEYWKLAEYRRLPIVYGMKAPQSVAGVSAVGNLWDWCADEIQVNGNTVVAYMGGSYLCEPTTCRGYEPQNRLQVVAPNTANQNLGFAVCDRRRSHKPKTTKKQ